VPEPHDELAAEEPLPDDDVGVDVG